MSDAAAAAPQVIVVGGPNGAGKSTFADEMFARGYPLPNFVNADTIARGLALYGCEALAVEAGRIMLRRLRALAAARESFAFETTLSGRAHAKFLKDLKAEGYHVVLFFVGLRRPEVSVQRVAQRVQAGGHNIPTQDLRRRFPRVYQNLFELYLPLAETWQIYDNTEGQQDLIAEGNPQNREVVHDPTTFREFKDIAHGGQSACPSHR